MKKNKKKIVDEVARADYTGRFNKILGHPE